MPPPSAAAPSSRLLPLLAVALVYLLLGWVASTLAIPPGYASPIYPAAGLALVAVLVYGRSAVVAVWAGSFVLNVLIGLSRGTSGSALWILPVLIGIGAALQAWAGAWLVRRSVRPPLTLDSPAAIARFFGFGALLACLLSATVGTAALWHTGLTATGEPFVTWLTWWAGDALGVAIAAPVALSLIGRPAEAWRPRRSSVALPLLLSTLLLALAIGQVERWQSQRMEARFERDAESIVRTVALRLDAHLDALDALYGVYLASNEVDRQEFHRASQIWLHKLPSVQAIGWHERVSRDAIPAFEARVHVQDGRPEYRVFERDATLTVGDQDAMVMRFVEPLEGNAVALGINVRSVAATREAMDRALQNPGSWVTDGFRLTQEIGDQLGAVVYRAVRHASEQDPGGQASLRGVIFLTLRLDDALRTLLEGLPDYLEVCLVDTSASPPTRLAGSTNCLARTLDKPLTRHEPLSFAGRSWQLRVHAGDGVPPEAAGPLGDDNGAVWLFSLTGLAATGLMGALLLIVTGRTRRIEAAVHERTLQLQHEVAERRLTEQALRDSEQRFRSIFNSVPVGVVYTDLQGNIKQVNARFAELAGRSETELLTGTTLDMTHPDDLLADQQARDRLIAGEAAVAHRRKRLVASDGSTHWVDASTTLLRDDEGAPFRLVALVEDISEHLRLKEAERARESAEAANRAKSEFLSRMSHELRTPLNAMLGFAQLLEIDSTPRLDARHAQWVGQIRRAGWHLLEMINEVLDLSRIESGTLKLDIEPLRVEPLIAESMAMVEAQAQERRVHLLRALSEDISLRVMGDGTRIKQILINLLSNAIKYNRAEGEVKLITRRETGSDGGEKLVIEVHDNGLGMSTDQLDQLFQPFNRLGRERDSTEGTGIGLVISRLLAERLGGRLSVSSREGEGSCFALTLPLATETIPATEAGPLAESATDYHLRQVLYIEDNEINIEIMRGIFAQRPQVQFEVASTGLDGLATVRTAPPDMILLDMHLPDIDGMSLLEHLQSDPATADIPVIVVSADALPAQIEAALAAGATRYLTKPISVDEILMVIDEVLSQLQTRFG